MKNLITANLYVIMLYSLYANAAIDVKAAYSDALELVAIKFLIAAIAFYILSFGLINKPKDTAIKNGRWYGALLAAISIISTATLNKTDVDLYYGSAIMTVVWFAIGYFVGYVWFKFKKVEVGNMVKDSAKSNENTKAGLPKIIVISLVLLVGIFILNKSNNSDKFKSHTNSKSEHIFDVYECKEARDECQNYLKTDTFVVDKLSSKVIVKITNNNDNKIGGFYELEDCIVVDDNNWQCGGSYKFESGVEKLDAKYTMVNGNLTISDSYLKLYNAGRLTFDSPGNESSVNYIKRN